MAPHATSRRFTEWQQRSRLTHLPNKLTGQGPSGPASTERHVATVIARRLDTIHPNPGPTRRGKTKRSLENKVKRNERRLQKRKKKRTVHMKRAFPIVCWNLQGISMRENNRARLKNTIGYISTQRWEITMISELRSDSHGVTWLGKGKETTAVIHPSKVESSCAVLPLTSGSEGNR